MPNLACPISGVPKALTKMMYIEPTHNNVTIVTVNTVNECEIDDVRRKIKGTNWPGSSLKLSIPASYPAIELEIG